MKKPFALMMAMLLVAAVAFTPFALADTAPPADEMTPAPVSGEPSDTALVDSSPPVTIDLTAIVNALLLVLTAIITQKLLPYLKSKMTAAQYAQFETVVRVGVYAAEEIFRSGNGDKKLEYVKSYLKKKGYDVDIDQIKAAVRQMRGQSVAVEAEGVIGSDCVHKDDCDPNEDTDEPVYPVNPA